MKTRITRYPGEYVQIGHYFIGVQEIFEDRAMLHIGCDHEDIVVTLVNEQAYKTPDGETVLIASIGYDTEGASCCTLGLLTPDSLPPVRWEELETGVRLQ